ncbi:MAG: hypothetical protein LAP39_21180 [Acidobacteriia bacterium]|nr:hypothetical protein [Terriglobia bacterium]
MGEYSIKYLEMLQAVIGRMAGNQFTLRTWSVGLGTAVIGYGASKEGHPKAALLAIFPAIVFWFLDAYYLALEREFRVLFSTALGAKGDQATFSFAASVTRTDLLEAFRRPAVWLVHSAVIVMALVVGALTWLR